VTEKNTKVTEKLRAQRPQLASAATVIIIVMTNGEPCTARTTVVILAMDLLTLNNSRLRYTKRERERGIWQDKTTHQSPLYLLGLSFKCSFGIVDDSSRVESGQNRSTFGLGRRKRMNKRKQVDQDVESSRRVERNVNNRQIISRSVGRLYGAPSSDHSSNCKEQSRFQRIEMQRGRLVFRE